MAPPRVDFLVLGAGVVGCALAYHLARRRAGTVQLYDPRPLAAGATGRAAGVVTEQLWDRWDVEVTRASRTEYAELGRTGDPDAFRTAGFVRWTREPAGAAALGAARDRLRAWGVAADEVGRSELEAWFPAGRFDDLVHALHTPGGAVVRPSSLATAYARAAERSGAVVEVGRRFGRLVRGGDGWELETDAGAVRARSAVVAAGAWSKALLAGLGHPLPLAPYRTQAALLRPTPAAVPCPTAHDLDTDVYVRAEEAGRLLAGDGTERVECDPDRASPGGSPDFVAHLATALARRFPGWADAEVLSSWAGVCTATPDRHPLVGAVPGATDLYVCAGFNGFGVMRAGGVTGRLASVLVEAPGPERTRAILGPADVARFSGPPAPFAPTPGFTVEPGEAPRY